MSGALDRTARSGLHGVVLSGTGGVWRILGDDGRTYEASLRGRLKHGTGEDEQVLKLAVGDRVVIAGGGGAHVIEVIEPRRSVLARREPGGRQGQRVVVANVDQVVVVFAAARPEPHPRMLDRFLVIAEANGLVARIVINKIDLVPEERARERFADYIVAGYPVHFTSVAARAGLDGLRDALGGRVSALSGPSGVGKSSLLNALYPGLDLRIGAISESVNKGRHTTVGALLTPLPDGGFVADTPGLREVGVWGIAPSDLAPCFPEFRAVLGQCRFADCAHLAEPGCAVRELVSAGRVSRERYESYVRLYGELEEAQRG